MTVGELIEKLQAFHPDAPLVWYNPENSYKYRWSEFMPLDDDFYFGCCDDAPSGTVSLGRFG